MSKAMANATEGTARRKLLIEISKLEERALRYAELGRRETEDRERRQIFEQLALRTWRQIRELRKQIIAPTNGFYMTPKYAFLVRTTYRHQQQQHVQNKSFLGASSAVERRRSLLRRRY
jgi:hypothetical protein